MKEKEKLVKPQSKYYFLAFYGEDL